MKKSCEILVGLACTAGIIGGFVVSTYLWALPAVVSNSWIHIQVAKTVKKSFDTDLTISGVELKTGLNIGFKLKELSLKKENDEILNLSGIDTEFSLKEIFAKRLIVKKVLANNVYVNASELMALMPEQEEKKEVKEAGFNIDIYSALFGVKKCLITYSDSEIGIKFDAQNLMMDRTKEKKYLHFDFDFELAKGNDKIIVSADDQNRIYMGNGELHVNAFPIEIDKSKIIISAFASRKMGIEANISSKNFSARDIFNIITSNLIIPNGKELLAPICNVDGNADFNIHLTKSSISGDVNVNKAYFEIKDLLNLPVEITQGIVEIGNKDIKLRDFAGFYNNKKINDIKMKGDVKDYWKTCDTEIVSNIKVNDDFFKNYASKLLGAPIGLVGDAGSQLTLKSKNGSCDIVWYFLLNENEGFMLGDQSMVLKDYKTLFKIDLSVVKNILKLNTIDYYITDKLQKGMTPVLAIKGNIDMADDMKLLDLDLNIPRPLPSEFLNFLCCQKIFKKGTIFGKLSIDNNGEFPKMDGVIELSKVRIPSQRLYIESAKFGAKGDKLGAIANGRFKRSTYDFSGYVVNDLRLPIVVKNVNLTVDNVDVERLLAVNTGYSADTSIAREIETSALSQGNNITPSSNSLLQEAEEISSDSDDIPTFTKGLIIVEKCMFNLESGKYKDVSFGNLHANLTLDKDGVLKLQSNKFDIAEGISTLKVKADLIKNNYYLRLGVKDVNSDVMASAVLGLPREISGKARGLIEIYTDETLKLNGDIKFEIKDGTIEKVGYVEYLLKAASLFRNPLAMISPTTIGDLVTIPNGEFESISGELKIVNNVILPLQIRSSANTLATYIVGKYNLENNDATLRIYTKFSDKDTGFAGFLRNISLNSIANRISTSGRTDANYYASELVQIPKLKTGEDNAQIFLTKVDGDVINFNFLSSLKRIK